jgi:hypothetical protein
MCDLIVEKAARARILLLNIKLNNSMIYTYSVVNKIYPKIVSSWESVCKILQNINC